MTQTKIKKYVLTGGPSVGKSTLLEVLREKGIYTIAEVATYIIEQELEKEKRGKNSDILPWKNKQAFQKKVLETQLGWEARTEKLNGETRTIMGENGPTKVKALEREIEITIQDRGVPDGIAYYLIDNLQPPIELLEAARKADYAGVFILELVEYKNTAVRKEDPETAKRIHEKIREVYKSLGYKPITIPAVSVEKRAELILNKIKEKEEK